MTLTGLESRLSNCVFLLVFVVIFVCNIALTNILLLLTNKCVLIKAYSHAENQVEINLV